jgi:hypothetical protein
MWFLLSLFVAAALWGIVHTRHVQQAESHHKIMALANKLSECQCNKDELRQIVNQLRFRGLTLHDDSSDEWAVEAPIEIGATNWVLYIDVRDSRAVGLRVRTSDSKMVHPKNAPPDESFQRR